MKTIIVTGCAGFIGSHVAEKLLQRGDRVIGIDEVNDYYSIEQKQNNLSILNEFDNFVFYKEDLANYSVIEEIYQEHNPEYLAHLAARAGVRPSIENPFIYEQSNIKATLNLLELSRKFELVNSVITSSSSVYGECSVTPFTEDMQLDKPISPYAATKKSCELLSYTYHHLYNMNIIIVRPFTIYGPRGRPDMAPFLFTEKISKGEVIKQFGDGTTQRDYTYIDDFVSGFISALDKPMGYEIFNLGNSNPVSLNDFISTIEEVVDKKANIEKHPMQPGDVSMTYADTSKAREKLGYQCGTPLSAGIGEFWKWYQDFYGE